MSDVGCRDRDWMRGVLARYEPMVARIARGMKAALRGGGVMDEDDLRSVGRMAVLEAVSRYDFDGVEEHRWVRTRVRHRMIDALRRFGLTARKGVPASREALRTRRVRYLSMLDVNEKEAWIRPASFVQPPNAADELVDYKARWERLRGVRHQVPPRQWQALMMGIEEGLLLREIAERLGVSESRVCQLQRAAVSRLRDIFVDPHGA